MIALIVILVLGGAVYLGMRISRGEGYQFGVHFPTAAGVAPGAQVYLSGVNIGSVAKVIILPDNSVDFIIHVFRDTDIPKTAKFGVLTSLTGSPSVAIAIPEVRAVQNAPVTPVPREAVWPRRVLPVSEQPQGSPPLTLEAFMRQSRTLGDRAYKMLAQARPYGKRLAFHLQNARANGSATVEVLRSTGPQLMGSVQSTIERAQANVQSAQRALRTRDQPEIAQLARSFQSTIVDMRATAGTLQQLKRDPRMRENVRAATAQLRTVTSNLAGLTRDMEAISGNPQTKAQLQDAGARLRDILRRL